MANKFDVNHADSKADTFDMADDKDSTAQLFSSMLPFLLLIFLYSGCISVAPESIAGEKERGTIASLLITPVKRSHIALGKIARIIDHCTPKRCIQCDRNHCFRTKIDVRIDQ